MNRKTKILIINDDNEMAQQMKRWLKLSGFEVQTLISGKEGVDLVKRKIFDLILLDFNLDKELNGAKTANDFIPQFNRIEPFIPIIVTSANKVNLSRVKYPVSKKLTIDGNFWQTIVSTIKQTSKDQDKHETFKNINC